MITKEEKYLRESMYVFLNKHYLNVTPPSWSVKQMLETGYNFNEAKKQYVDFNQNFHPKPTDKILDVGCGFGYFVSYCLKKGVNCYGYEVDKTLTAISKKLLQIYKQNPNRIVFVSNYKTPFKNNTFDYAHLHFIIDYCSNIPQLVKELRRIVKPNGQIYIISPNYQCGYSPVYAAFLFPFLPRFINKLYLSLIHRPNMSFYDHLNFVNPHMLENIFKDFGFQIENLGARYWEELLSGKCDNRSNTLTNIIRFSHRHKISPLLKGIAKLGFYTPLVYRLTNQKPS